jgi:hypothetical protein
MKRFSRDYIDFLESVIFSLLKEREQNGYGYRDFDGFTKVDLDRGPNDTPEIYIPCNVRDIITKTYKEFVESGYKEL